MFGTTAIKVIDEIEKQNNKVKSKRKDLSFEERVNAEFKHLNKRIKRLEQIVLKQHIDSGSITENNIKLKKG
jgi:hypothetical protein